MLNRNSSTNFDYPFVFHFWLLCHEPSFNILFPTCSMFGFCISRWLLLLLFLLQAKKVCFMQKSHRRMKKKKTHTTEMKLKGRQKKVLHLCTSSHSKYMCLTHQFLFFFFKCKIMESKQGIVSTCLKMLAERPNVATKADSKKKKTFAQDLSLHLI